MWDVRLLRGELHYLRHYSFLVKFWCAGLQNGICFLRAEGLEDENQRKGNKKMFSFQTWGVSSVWTLLHMGCLVSQIRSWRKLQCGKLELIFLSSPLSALLNFFLLKLDILSGKILERTEMFVICILRQPLGWEAGLHMCRNYCERAFCSSLLGQCPALHKHLVCALTGICGLVSWLVFALAAKVGSGDLAGCTCISVCTQFRFNYGN